MDPNATLAELLELAHALADQGDEPDPDDAARLVELTLAMDAWLVGDGFAPDRWRSNLAQTPDPA